MARTPKPNPSFFKVLIGNFTLRLRLPPLFVLKYGELLPEKVTLTTDGGESWKVKLEEDEGHHYFTKGWVKFVEDLHLTMGTFLVFHLVGSSTINVSVYGPSGCKMELRDCKIETEDLLHRRSARNARGKQAVYNSVKEEGWSPTSEYTPQSSCKKMNPQFRRVLKKRDQYNLRFYKSFATETKLLCKTFVVLEGMQGRHWTVALRMDGGCGRLAMTAGWKEFQKDNNIVVGDTCLFEFIPGKNVILVKVIKSQN